MSAPTVPVRVCPECGQRRVLRAGEPFPVHPDPSRWPRFRWCRHLTPQEIIVNVPAWPE